jgi:hypothetical protein
MPGKSTFYYLIATWYKTICYTLKASSFSHEDHLFPIRNIIACHIDTFIARSFGNFGELIRLRFQRRTYSTRLWLPKRYASGIAAMGKSWTKHFLSGGPFFFLDKS